MNNTGKKVVAIIVTYNGEQWINKCFSSLLSGSCPVHVLAIDNASSDATAENTKRDFPEVELITTGNNLGFGKANNIGFKRAVELNADYIFLLNQDAWVEHDTIEQLVNVAEKNKDFGLISPVHLLPGKQKLEWFFSTYVVPGKCADFYSDIYFNKPGEIYALPFVNAAAWLIPAATLDVVGGFDPLFPHYGEDEDYCNRLIYYKLKIGLAPAAIITHDITYRSWEEIKFNFQRQLIFVFIDLKNIRFSYKYSLYIYITRSVSKLFSLLIFRKWRELKLMNRVFFSSLKYISKINRARKEAKQSTAYLK